LAGHFKKGKNDKNKQPDTTRQKASKVFERAGRADTKKQNHKLFSKLIECVLHDLCKNPGLEMLKVGKDTISLASFLTAVGFAKKDPRLYDNPSSEDIECFVRDLYTASPETTIKHHLMDINGCALVFGKENKIKLAPTEQQILKAIPVFDPDLVSESRNELEQIAEKSPFESVRKAAKEKSDSS